MADAGRVALITGGARGIGKAIGLDLARAGWAVAFCYRTSETAAAETRAALESAGARALALRADVSDSAAAEDLVRRVERAWGRIDALVHCAGPYHRVELLQETQARLHATYLYVTHDREEALRAAHRIGVLNAGRLEQVGTPEELYHRPTSAFVAEFVGPMNWFAGVLGENGLRLDSGQEIPCDHSAGNHQASLGRVRLGVRPEHVQLDATGFLMARVVHRQFAGASISLCSDCVRFM